MSQSSKDVCEQTTFRGLFMAHAEDLRNFLYYRCGKRSQAEDFAQEAFLRLWKNCAKVPFDKAKGFLFTVANNLFLNEVKHQKVVLHYQQQQPTQEKNTETPQRLIEQEEFRAQLKQAVEDLPEGQRTVFLLNRSSGKTYREIAEMLGISVKAVEKRMHKALVQLRKTIKNKDD